MHGKRTFHITALTLLALGAAMAKATSGPTSRQGGGGPAVCAIAGGPIAIGNYNPLETAPSFGIVSWQFTCYGPGAGVTPRSVTLHSAEGERERLFMTDGRGHRLEYRVCFDAACTRPLGTEFGNLDSEMRPTATGQKNLTAESMLVYAMVLPRQNVPAGAYKDALTVTVQY